MTKLQLSDFTSSGLKEERKKIEKAWDNILLKHVEVPGVSTKGGAIFYQTYTHVCVYKSRTVNFSI